MTFTTVTMSGVRNIDALLGGARWTDGRVDFAFTTAQSDYGAYAHTVDHDGNASTPAVSVNETVGWVTMSPAQRDAARDAFHALSLVTSYSTLEWTPANADVRLAMTTTMDPRWSTAYAFGPGGGLTDGDTWFNTTGYNNPHVGTYAYQTFFHEIGHTLGLKHGHEGTTQLSTDRNSLEFSTMTYASFIGAPVDSYKVTPGHYPQSFMMLDIQALQYLYGPSYGTYTGDTTWRFDPVTGETTTGIESFGVPKDDAGRNVNVLFRTVWDGGGTDTYDFSAYDSTRQLRIDLAPGGWTDVDTDSDFQAADLDLRSPGTQMARGQVFNAPLYNNDPRSLIENAIGGAGDDHISGNQARNRLEGRNGNDTLEGFDNDDTLIGGAGGDLLDGGAGYDTVDYSASAGPVQIEQTAGPGYWEGKIVGGDGDDDTLVGIEAIVASPFGDLIRVNEGNQVLYGGGGDDVLQAGAGADYLNGGDGHDSTSFGAAVTINLATGVHTGEAAGDTYISIERFNGSSAADTMVASNNLGAEFAGGDGNDALYGGQQDDWLQGGKGEDYLAGGNGHDIVSYADAPHYITADLSMKDATHDGKITAGEWGFDTLVDIEGVEGSAYDDTLLGDDEGNTFLGGAGNDRLEGRGGTDVLDGGPGNDSLNGELGNDYHYGRSGDDVLWVNPGADVMDGGDGFDTMAFTRPMVADWQSGVLDADIAGDAWYAWEAIAGSSGADRIRTNSWGFAISLYGNGGDDVLACGNGNDSLLGGPGADYLTGGLGADQLAGGDGDDCFADTAAGLQGDSVADFAIGDRFEVAAVAFTALRYTAANGLLELDTGADGSFATRLTLPAGLVGDFVATPMAGWTEVRLLARSGIDTDGDGIADDQDNAIDVPNPDQRDTDGDGYGNVVDPDLNQDLLVDLFDLSLFEAAYGSADANADFNGDASVDLFDLSVLDSYFGGRPGRSYVDGPAGAASAGASADAAAAAAAAAVAGSASAPWLQIVGVITPWNEGDGWTPGA